jgi:lysyl-tRNA synthetase class 2
MTSGADWQPVAARALLELRATMLRQTREFFATRGVLEVETPLCVQHTVTDPQLQSLQVSSPGDGGRWYLHTSAEYAMKRLLAGGSGDIYQICHVFRGGEHGALHNHEFTMLEWYRLGFTLADLMQEVRELLGSLLGPVLAGGGESPSYATVMQRSLGIDPLTDSDATIRDCAAASGFEPPLLRSCDRDQLLDLLMGARVGPTLGNQGPCFVHHYPASQAALACLDPGDARVALRFEVYLGGMELANGFEELGAADQQRKRFEADLQVRRQRELAQPAIDERLLSALAHGLPSCSGVALGFDRLLMQASGSPHIDQVLSFPASRA